MLVTASVGDVVNQTWLKRKINCHVAVGFCRSKKRKRVDNACHGNRRFLLVLVSVLMSLEIGCVGCCRYGVGCCRFVGEFS